LYTFRVSGVPVSLRESAVADLILGLVNDLGGRPGVDYKVAYNVTWDALCAGGLVSGEGNVSLEEIQALHGYTKYTLSFLLGKGQLAASRPPQMKGGHRPVIINKADLDYYLSHKKAKGRPLKKES
jgi:hypothetical protein